MRDCFLLRCTPAATRWRYCPRLCPKSAASGATLVGQSWELKSRALAWALVTGEQKRDQLGAAVVLPSGQQMCNKRLPGVRGGRALALLNLLVTPFSN